VRGARRFVDEALHQLTPDLCETAALLVSELATNAVLHATSQFDVTVVYPARSGRVRIEVADNDPTPPTLLRSQSTDPHGRGLLLVAALSAAWGVQRVRRRVGKTVWFELSPTPSPGH
jgi:anti-sigma regulatory factor (Ser/Thr protein kinase)